MNSHSQVYQAMCFELSQNQHGVILIKSSNVDLTIGVGKATAAN